MPITIKQNLMKYKSDRLHKYVGINSVAERATADQIEDIEAAGANTIAEVNAAIAAGQTAIDGIETQKNQMIASIAQVAGQGTDATFTQQGVAADAKAVGDLKSALINDQLDITWINGHTSDGTFSTSTKYISPLFVLSYKYGYASITVPSNCEMFVCAWENGEYIGALRITDTFSKTGTAKFVNRFNLYDYPDYEIAVCVRHKDTTDISTSEGENFSVQKIYNPNNTSRYFEISSMQYEQGNISDGQPGSSDKYLRSVNPMVGKIMLSVTLQAYLCAWRKDTGEYVGVLRTNGDFGLSGDVKHLVNEIDFNVYAQYLIKICISNKNNTNITVSDIDEKTLSVIPVFLSYEGQKSNLWMLGSFSDGGMYPSAKRVILKKRASYKTGDVAVRLPVGYKMYVVAWDKNGNYLGVLRENNSFAISGNTKYLSEFSFASYPEYWINVAVQKTNGEDISLADANSFTYLIDHSLYQSSENLYLKEIVDATNCGIISASRLGYGAELPGLPPENSIAGYKMAYQHGFRVMLADVNWTQDLVPVPVCLHDETINRVARNSDGTTISSDLYINNLTLEQVDQYDFGIIKGGFYSGLKIMRVDEFLRWCKLSGCRPILEIKHNPASNDELNALYAVIDKYDIGNKCSFIIEDAATILAVHQKYPNAELMIVCTSSSNYSTMAASIASAKENNNVLFAIYNAQNFTGVISDAMINVCKQYGFGIYFTEIKNESQIETFLSDANNLFCTYVAIRFCTFGKYIADKILN